MNFVVKSLIIFILLNSNIFCGCSNKQVKFIKEAFGLKNDDILLCIETQYNKKDTLDKNKKKGEEEIKKVQKNKDKLKDCKFVITATESSDEYIIKTVLCVKDININKELIQKINLDEVNKNTVKEIYAVANYEETKKINYSSDKIEYYIKKQNL